MPTSGLVTFCSWAWNDNQSKLSRLFMFRFSCHKQQTLSKRTKELVLGAFLYVCWSTGYKFWISLNISAAVLLKIDVISKSYWFLSFVDYSLDRANFGWINSFSRLKLNTFKLRSLHSMGTGDKIAFPLNMCLHLKRNTSTLLKLNQFATESFKSKLNKLALLRILLSFIQLSKFTWFSCKLFQLDQPSKQIVLPKILSTLLFAQHLSSLTSHGDVFCIHVCSRSVWEHKTLPSTAS